MGWSLRVKRVNRSIKDRMATTLALDVLIKARGIMQGVPKSKLEEINDQIGKFADAYSGDLKLNEILYIRIKNSLDDCIRRGGQDVGLAYAFLATLYSYKYDHEKYKEYIDRAERILGDLDEDWAHNCIAGAVNLGEFHVAREVLDRVTLEDPWWLNYKINIYASMGLVDSALQCSQRLRRMESKDHSLLDRANPLKNAKKASEVLAMSSISQELIFEMVSACAKVVGEVTKKPLVKYALSANYEGGILYTFIVDEPVEKMIDMEWLLSECMIENFDMDVSGVFNACVSYPREQ